MENKLTEERLADIILCEPITKKGKRELERLDLSKNEISIEYFYENIYVSSQYKGDYIREVIDEDDEDESFKEEEFISIRDEYDEFKERLNSNRQNTSPLFIIGVAGNGKSIEVNKVLYHCFKYEEKSNQLYIDFEDTPKSKLTYGIEFPIPDQNSVLWFFCGKIMESIMEYIIANENKCFVIRQTFYDDIYSIRVIDEHKSLFNAIGDYKSADRESAKRIFNILKGFVNNTSKEDIRNGLQSLVKILLWLMYCTDRKKMNYIIFDNIESFIYLNENSIQILDDDIKDICVSIRNITDDVIREFNSYMGGNPSNDLLGWQRFKVIIVARRTSLAILDKMVLHRPRLRRKNIVDITGHFNISEIWNNKKTFVWEKYLKEKYIEADPECERIINLADFIFADSRKTRGKSYQLLIAPLMSYGIRRNAYTQARAIIRMHKQLIKNTEFTISYSQFNLLREAGLGQQASFILRRALIESQFRWSIIDRASRKRWGELGIGHYKYNEKGRIIFRQKRPNGINYAPVSYKDPNNITLMHRILSCLSNYPDYASGVSKPIDTMFATVSLYDLINEVIFGPNAPHHLSKDELEPFARVLISLCDMSNDETKAAPFAILGIRSSEFHKNPSPNKLAGILVKIYDAGKDESMEEGEYNAIDYGVRLTDAGYSFLSKWMPSFSFMESLYCYPLPSLFYLNRYTEIEFVISKVYDAAKSLGNIYEKEALKFCNDPQKFNSGKYLYNYNGDPISFRDHICREHINFLNQYNAYILESYRLIGLGEDDSIKIKSLIEHYKNKYEFWREEKKCTICF